jgi:hypothetical protein
VALVGRGVQRGPVLLRARRRGRFSARCAPWRLRAARAAHAPARCCGSALRVRRDCGACDRAALCRVGRERLVKRRGGARTAVVAVTLAPLDRSSFTSSKWPWYAARCSDARPSCAAVRGAPQQFAVCAARARPRLAASSCPRGRAARAAGAARLRAARQCPPTRLVRGGEGSASVHQHLRNIQVALVRGPKQRHLAPLRSGDAVRASARRASAAGAQRRRRSGNCATARRKAAGAPHPCCSRPCPRAAWPSRAPRRRSAPRR